MTRKTRIDKLLFEKGMAPSRERARAYIMAGNVLVEEQKIDKPGTMIPHGATIRLKNPDQPYVSRGGLKLEKALKEFKIDVRHQIALDIGASTGGFTDCLLQNGAAFVFSVDVGYGQLAWKLAQNPKVQSLEKQNFRHLPFDQIGTFVDLIVIDVSFISLTKILKNCLSFLTKKGKILALVKPQFEAGKANIKKGGLVTDHHTHEEVIQSVKQYAEEIGLNAIGTITSPIEGKKSGNKEFLIYLKGND